MKLKTQKPRVANQLSIALVLMGLVACSTNSEDKNLASTSKVVTQNESKPNILFIMADDLGYGELGAYGQDLIRTPFIDSLAGQGLRFTNFYAGNTVCAPSRSSLLTGRPAGSAFHRGNRGYKEGWTRIRLPDNTPTLGSMMKALGYATGFFGKWHLDDDGDESVGLPGAFGFDLAYSDNVWSRKRRKELYNEHAQMADSSIFDDDYFTMYPAFYYVNGEKTLTGYNTKETENRVYDAIMVDKAKEFISGQTSPWFAMVSFNIPHAPEILLDAPYYEDKGWPEAERIHAARITFMDGLLKDLVELLEASDQLDNTLVVFTSDNGNDNSKSNKDRDKFHDYRFFKSNGDLRGKKRDMYEGGIRVPAIIYWKGKIKPSETNHVAAFHDFMPTFSELGGGSGDVGEGISMYPLLNGAEQKQHDHLYWEFQMDGSWQLLPDGGFRQAVRKDNWKLVRHGVDNSVELYDLSKDISESNDLSKQYPDTVKMMKQIMESSRSESSYFPHGGVKSN